jgi:hypothetical protein
VTDPQKKKPLLLLGAGFSRNWGGWLAVEAFEYLLGCAEVSANPRLKHLLWNHQPRGGFEEALAAVQRQATHSGKDADLKVLESAIARMFDTMNKGYVSAQSLEFVNNGMAWLHRFMLRFDAIFTLNQDTLLEQHYMSPSVLTPTFSDPRWAQWHLPGMVSAPLMGVDPPGNNVMVPGAIKEVPRSQPIYKLHGSSLWRDPSKGSVMILGANKEVAIQSHGILRRYSEEFRARLAEKGARLMVIGYGFRDVHINAVITGAVHDGLEFYVIDPLGSNLVHAMDSSRLPGAGVQIMGPAVNLETAFRRGLIGASRRSLREIFGGDDIEYAKVVRFFDA